MPETTSSEPSGTSEAAAAGGLAAVGGAGAAILSSVTPQSTTADLAGAVPKESQTEARDATVSSVTPESTTADLAGAVPKENQTEARDTTVSSVTPESTTAGLAGAVPKEDAKNAEGDDDKPATTLPDEPAYSSAPPGAFPETPAHETEEYGVKPIPASEGIGNPVSLPAGEKVPDPSEINSNTVDSTVTTSKEGYEQDASAIFPVAAAAGIAGATGVGADEHEEKPEADSFGVNPIPASAGIGNPISVPAGEKIPEQSSFNPNTVESTATTSKEGYEENASADLLTPAVVAGTTGVGAAADSALSVPETSKNMIPESSLPMGGEVKDTTDTGPFISSAAANSTSSHLASTVPLEPKREAKIVDEEEDEAPSATLSGPAPTIPEMVQESLSEAHQSPEAAASAEAVSEKALVENELLSKVKSTDAAGEPAPSPAAEGTSSAPVSSVASNVPAVVKDSISQAHQPAEAAAAQEVVNEKRDVESELLREVKPTDAVGEPAPTVAAATSETAPKATSEDALGGATAAATTLVSPTAASDAPTQAAPYEAVTPAKETTTEAPSTTAVTAENQDLSPGSEDPKAPATPAKEIATSNTPAKTTPGPAATGTTMTSSATSSPASSATKEQKKKNRRSLLGRLKDRFKAL